MRVRPPPSELASIGPIPRDSEVMKCYHIAFSHAGMNEASIKGRSTMKRRGARGGLAVATIVAALFFGMGEYGSGRDFSSAKAIAEVMAALGINLTEAAQNLASEANRECWAIGRWEEHPA
jgi:hypothetical protein